MQQDERADPTSVEVAWAAGLFEGEGTVGWHRSRGRGMDGNAYPSARLKSTDEDVIRKLHRVIGGKVYGPYKRRTREHSKHKPYWDWNLRGWLAVQKLFQMFKPYLGKRRMARFKEILARAPLIPRGECNTEEMDVHAVDPDRDDGTAAGTVGHEAGDAGIASTKSSAGPNANGDADPGSEQFVLWRAGVRRVLRRSVDGDRVLWEWIPDDHDHDDHGLIGAGAGGAGSTGDGVGVVRRMRSAQG